MTSVKRYAICHRYSQNKFPDHVEENEECDNGDNTQADGIFIYSLPDEIIQEIFLHIPGRDLVSHCVCVCKRWSKIIQTQQLWKWKCNVEHGYPTDLMKLMTTKDDFRTLYFKNPYNSNLILNPEALEGLKHWYVKAEGEFRVETKHCHLRWAENADPDIHCWIPTYRNHSKEQVIDLLARGCSTQMLDIIRPAIKISDWYTGYYTLKVELLQTLQDAQPMALQNVKEKKLFAGRFHCARITIQDYEPGLRFIRFRHGGRQLTKQDHYDDHCTKITHSSVCFDLG